MRLQPCLLYRLSLSTLLIMGLVTACAASSPPAPTATAATTATATAGVGPTATIRPTGTPAPSLTPRPSPSPEPPTWGRIAPGVQRALIPVPIPGTEEAWLVYTLRLDPARIDMRVLYDGTARDLPGWQETSRAPILFNGSFFTGEAAPVGRIVSDGLLYGGPLSAAYGPESIGVIGMFTLLDGVPELFTAGRSDYSPRDMRFDQALECYPILLLPGQQPAYLEDSGNRARRTVIGIDEEGYIVVMVIEQPIFSLYELAHWLPGSGLALDSALNLDGGRSSGMLVSLPAESIGIPAYVPLPIVVAVYLR